MDVTYKREMRHNYLIIEMNQEVYHSYEAKMVVNNRIEGFLKTNIKLVDNRLLFYYEITSKQPLNRLLDQHNITAEQIRKLVIGIANSLNHMETFLLIENQILLQPEFIYVEPKEYMIWLCFVPGTEGDFAEGLSSLFQYILGKVDHQDKDSVVLAYGLYQESIKENYGIEDLLKIVNKSSSKDMKEVIDKTPYCKDVDDRNLEKQSEPYSKQPETYGRGIISDRDQVSSKLGGLTFLKNKLLLMLVVIIGGPSMIYLFMGMRGLKEYGIWLFVLDLAVSVMTVLLSFIEIWKNPVSNNNHIDLSAGIQEINHGMGIKTQDRKILYNEDYEVNDFKIRQEKQVREETNEGIESKCTYEHEQNKAPLPSFSNITSQDTEILTNSKCVSDICYLMSLDKGIENIPLLYFPFIIGKQEGLVDYVLNKDVVSRLHLRIDHEDETYYITDLNSTNGTTVQGRLLETNETSPIKQGDHIYIANIGYVFT